MTQFQALGLAEPLLRALAHEGYETPTPIQEGAIPHLLAGRDLLGIAQTGTGKTASFTLPILHRLIQSGGAPQPKTCRALILAPTRELAAQIAESARAYGRFMRVSVTVVVGGVGHGAQIKALARGVDILVATPGRLLDHLASGAVRLDKAEVVVLDEADHMLDLGFVVPIRKILRCLPARRQSLFFSATMPPPIRTLAGEMLSDPVEVAVTPAATTVEKVSQQVYLVDTSQKRTLLADLLSGPEFARTLVFTRTKRGADRVTQHLEAAGLPADAIHGNKSQSQRERALAGFRAGRTRILVATDIAARGIDVDGVTHVVNFELPDVPESYVHRIGRTARAGAGGAAISFCDNGERGLLRDIERVTRQRLPTIDRRLAPGEAPAEPASAPSAPRGHGRPQQGRGQGPQQGRPHGQGQNRRPAVVAAGAAAGREARGRRSDGRRATMR